MLLRNPLKCLALFAVMLILTGCSQGVETVKREEDSP